MLKPQALQQPAPSFPHTTLQVRPHLANRSTLAVRKRESIFVLNKPTKILWIPASRDD